ncbi:unnamed protein product [Phaeothamnion confervicola]
MSEFQTGLLVIGALVVVGVLGYNKWQEYRAARAVDSALRSGHADVFAEDSPIGVGTPRPSDVDQEDSLLMQPQASPVLREASLQRTARQEEVLHDGRFGFDYVVDMNGEVQVGGLREEWSAVEQRFGRRAGLSGWADGQWAPVPHGGTCTKVHAALQLVSRRGVVSESELLEFRSMVETLAARLGMSVASPEMKDAHEAARMLDGACAEADIQIAFHVVAVPGAYFQGTKVRAAAEAAGFVLDSDGRFVLRDDAGREYYALTDRSAAKFSPSGMKDAAPAALTLSMDVPRVPETHRSFEAMVRFARNLAGLLGGQLVDDNGQPLDDRAVAAIDAQLGLVRRNLEARGIQPGSALALRLFS